MVGCTVVGPAFDERGDRAQLAQRAHVASLRFPVRFVLHDGHGHFRIARFGDLALEQQSLPKLLSKVGQALYLPMAQLAATPV